MAKSSVDARRALLHSTVLHPDGDAVAFRLWLLASRAHMASKRGNGRQAVRNGNGAPGWILFGSGLVVGAVLCAVVVLGGGGGGP